MNVQLAQARGEQLRAEVTAHKAAIRMHRERLCRAAAELQQLEAQCRAHGISVITIPTAGVGSVSHGRPSSS